MKATTENLVIKGIITPTEWDLDGAVAATAIAGIDGRDYRVIPDRRGRQLLAFARQGVAVHGDITYDREARPEIRIRQFEILGPVVDWDQEAT